MVFEDFLVKIFSILKIDPILSINKFLINRCCLPMRQNNYGLRMKKKSDTEVAERKVQMNWRTLRRGLVGVAFGHVRYSGKTGLFVVLNNRQ